MTPASTAIVTAPMPAVGGASQGSTSGAAAAGASAINPAPSPPRLPPAIPASGSPGDVLLLDDFEEGDTNGWIVASTGGDNGIGEWVVVDSEGGRAYAQRDTSFDDDSWAVGGNVAWSDILLQARFRFTAAAEIEDALAMFAVRFQSREKYYYVEYRGDGSLKLRKRVDGSDTDLSSQDLDRVAVLGEWIDIGVRARGSSLQITIDGVAVGGEVVDADLGFGGIGLGVKESSAVEFDDVRVSVP
jgi:hypothetical protein